MISTPTSVLRVPSDSLLLRSTSPAAERARHTPVAGQSETLQEPIRLGNALPSQTSEQALVCDEGGLLDSTLTTNITVITTTITAATARIEQWMHGVGGRDEGQITISTEELEQLSSDLSATSSQMVELRQHHAELSRNFNDVNRELQVTLSRSDEKDRTIASLTAEVTQWKNMDVAKAQQITAARLDNEILRRNLSAASSRTAELQQQYDAQSSELGFLRNELQTEASLIEKGDRTIATFAAEVAQWRESDFTKAGQIVTLERDLSTLSSLKADLQKRYDAQTRELGSVRNELRANRYLVVEREHTIASLSDEVAQAKREDSVKTGQIVTARRNVEQLRRELSSASSRMGDLQKRYEAQSQELNSVRDELYQIEILSTDRTDQVPGKTSKNAVAQHIALALEKKNKQMKELSRDLATSTSQNNELQKLYEVLSKEVSAVRDELKVKTSQHERTVTSLTAQVDEWKRADAAKAARIATTLEQVEKLQRDLSTSTSQLTELQSHYEAQSREIIALRDELVTRTPSNEGKEHINASLVSQVEEWKRTYASKADELATMREGLEELRRRLSSSTSQIAESQQRYAAQSAELATTQKDLERLRRESRDLISVRDELRIFQAQTTEIQKRYEEQLRDLKSTIAECQPQLFVVQRFFTIADKHANTIIIQMLHQVNEDVQLITQNMAECMVEDFQPRATKPTEEQISAAQRVSESIGQTLASCLEKKERSDMASYLRIAFQAYLIYHLCWIISSWTVEKGRNDLINEIYERLQKSGKRLRFECHQLFNTREQRRKRYQGVGGPSRAPTFCPRT